MRFDDLLKTMLYSFFVIIAGIVASMYVFCAIFIPDAVFTLRDIGGILIMAAASELPHLIFLSRKDLNRRQMLIRYIIHFPVLMAILLGLAFIFKWVALNSAAEVTVFVIEILVVYAMVRLAISYRDKKLADKLNDGLRKRYHS